MDTYYFPVPGMNPNAESPTFELSPWRGRVCDAKSILSQYRGVSKYYFPMYLKEVEYRFHHRQEHVFKQLLKISFGDVSP